MDLVTAQPKSNVIHLPKPATLKSEEPYGLEPGFERAVVWHACNSPRFWSSTGTHVDPDLLQLAPAKLAVQTARTIAQELGTGPASDLIVLQRLRRQLDEGKVSHAARQEVADLFEEASAAPPNEDAVIQELAPVLQRRKHNEVIKTAMDDYARRGDFARVASLITEAGRIGAVEQSLGRMLGEASSDLILGARAREKLPMGIIELDLLLGGGLPIGCEGLFIAGSGGGKSMALAHAAATGVRDQRFVGYATLELPDAVIHARLLANLFAVPIDGVLETPDGLRRALELWQQRAPKLGRCRVESFTPLATRVQDLVDWVHRCEDEAGRKMELVVVDYADKMSSPKGSAKKDDSDYNTGREVFEGLRLFAEREKKWLWTASQPKRGKSGEGRKKDKRRLDLDDVADSMHKIRVADVVVTINPEDEEFTLLRWFVAKNRLSKARQSTEPLPHDWEIGRAGPVLDL